MKYRIRFPFAGCLVAGLAWGFLLHASVRSESPADALQQGPPKGTPLPPGALVRLGTGGLPHGPGVTAVAFSPDGKTLVTGSQDKTIRLWDVATGQERRRFEGHQDWVSAVVFSPDGKFLASGGRDWTVRLWEVATGREIAQLVGHHGGVLSLAFTSDGTTLASSGQDRMVVLWDVATGKELRRLTGHEDWVIGVAFSSDGQTLTSGSWDGTVRLWEANTGKERRRLAHHHGRVLAIALSPTSNTLAVANQNHPVRLCDRVTGRELGFLGEVSHRPLGLAFAPDGKTLAVANRDGTIRLWEVATGQEYRPLGERRHRLICLAFAPDGKVLASGSWDTSVLVWDLAGPGYQKPMPVLELTPQELESRWAELALEDAPRAHQAIWTLARAPGQTLPFLQERLQTVTVDPRRIIRLVGELDDPRYAVRENASKELEKLGKFAEPALEEAVKSRPSLEVRRRAERLLEKFDGQEYVPYGDWLRARRAFQVLEHMDAPEGRRLLQKLAAGAPQSWLTQEARRVVERLAKRSSGTP